MYIVYNDIMKIIKKFSIIFLISILFSIYCTNKNNSNKKEISDPFEDKVILKINGKEFKNKDFKKFISLKYKDIDISKKKKKNILLSRFFDTYIDNSILLYFADKEGIEISEDDVKKYVTSRHIVLNNSNKDSIKNILKLDKLIYLKIYQNISINDNEIKDYYIKNPKLFQKNQEIELYQIFLKDKDNAIKIRGELQNYPKLFEKFAKENSQLTDNSKNGYMGNFQKGELPKEMENVVFSLKVNQISRVVETKYGFHIFKVKKRRNARHEYLKNVSGIIRETLQNKKISINYNKYLTDLKNNSNIVINYKNLFFKYSNIPGEKNETKNNSNTINNADTDGKSSSK